MSIGAEDKDKPKFPDIPRINRVRTAMKKATASYLLDPFYHLFHFAFLAMIVAQLTRWELPWQFYVTLLFLGLTQLHDTLLKREVLSWRLWRGRDKKKE